MKNFATPLAIEGSFEQFKVLQPKLEALGYKKNSLLDSWPFLVTNYSNENGYIQTSENLSQYSKNRHKISANDEELLLALAAMVEGPEFHVGEYVQFDVDEAKLTAFFTKGCWDTPYILKIESISDGNLKFSGEQMRNAGYKKATGICSNITTVFKKLTKEQIINNFNKIAAVEKLRHDWNNRVLPKISDAWNLPSINMREMTAIQMPASKPKGKFLGVRFKNPTPLNVQKSASYIAYGNDKWLPMLLANGGYYPLQHEQIDKLKEAGVYELWFEPVYDDKKEKKFTMHAKDKTYSLQVSTDGIFYDVDNAHLNYEDLKNVIRRIDNFNNKRKDSPYVNYVKRNEQSDMLSYKFIPGEITTLDAGCMKGSSVKEWKEVIEYYESIKK